jgi:hypothetical protein
MATAALAGVLLLRPRKAFSSSAAKSVTELGKKSQKTISACDSGI